MFKQCTFACSNNVLVTFNNNAANIYSILNEGSIKMFAKPFSKPFCYISQQHLLKPSVNVYIEFYKNVSMNVYITLCGSS